MPTIWRCGPDENLLRPLQPLYEEVCLDARFSWKMAAVYLALGVACAIYLYPFVRVFSDAPDYGVFLNGAELVNRGAIPSRDFVEPQGPGSFVWLAIFFRLFGTSLATARAVLNGTGVGLALLAFYLSRRLGATGLFAVIFVTAVSIPLLPINSPHYDSNLFALGAVAVFLVAWDGYLKTENAPLWSLISAAALCGITTWMIQQKGFYVLAAMLLSLGWLLRKKCWKACLVMIGAYGFTLLVPLAVFAARHALADVWFANYVWPIRNYSNLNACPYGFPVWQNLAVTLSRDVGKPVAYLADVAFAVPFFVLAGLSLLLLIAAPKWLTVEKLPYWLAGYALWFSELHRIDMGHLRNGCVLLIILFFSLCEAGKNAWTRRLGTGCILCVVLAATTNFFASWDVGPALQTRRGEIHTKADAEVFAFLNAHTRPGDEVFVYPYQPIYYFAEQLTNPTRYSYLQYHLHTDGQFREAALDLERKRVRYVVYDTLLSGANFQTVFPAYRQPAKSQLIMEPYLEAHYRVVVAGGRFQIWERRE